MWMSEHVISSVPDDIVRRRTLEKSPPIPVASLPRAYYLPGVVCSGYVQHAISKVGSLAHHVVCSSSPAVHTYVVTHFSLSRHDTMQCRETVPENHEWRLHFLALTPDGWLFWWESREDGRDTLLKACERSQSDRVRRLTSYTGFWGGEQRRVSDRLRSGTVTLSDLQEQTPLQQARAWKRMAKIAGSPYAHENKEFSELVKGSFHVRSAVFTTRRRQEHGEWYTITLIRSGSETKVEDGMWLAFRKERDYLRWRARLSLFATSR